MATLLRILRQLRGLTVWPGRRRLTILGLTPGEGWSGTIVAIEGFGFSRERDENEARVGGMPALVLEAAPDRLRVLVGEGASSGPAEVTVAGQTVASPGAFTVLAWPDAGEFEQDGVPLFFHGPQRGTPRVGVQNQPVLVILAFPNDFNPGAAGGSLRQQEIASFTDVDRYWREVSYGSTSWAFMFTQWLPLPQSRQYYFWQREDIDRAILDFIQKTKRGAAIAGSRAVVPHQGYATAVVDVASPGSPRELSRAPALSPATAVALDGTRAYVAAGNDGLHVLDVDLTPPTPPFPWPAPTLEAKIPFAGWLHDVDVAGNLLAAAALDRGVVVYDRTTPQNPVQVGTRTFGTGESSFVTGVRLVGSRAFVTVGATLRVLDLSTPASPVEVASISTQARALGLDVEGHLCAVATDGKGVRLFDITTPTAPVAQGAVLTPATAYAVDLQANRAYVAAGDDGLRILDVSNPASPSQLGSVSLAAYGAVADGTRAYVSVGALSLAIVNVATASAPAVESTMYLRSSVIPPPVDPSPVTLRGAILYARNQQDLGKRLGALMVHALAAARAAGVNPTPFEGIIVVVNGPFLRGQSWVSNQVSWEGTTDSFSQAKGWFYVAQGSETARKAHEMGHWLGMADIYTEWYADGTFLPGTAAPWDLGGSGLTLFSGWHADEVIPLFSSAAPNVNVVERTWSMTAPALNETFDIVAHDATQDADPNRIHVLKLPVAAGLTYYVEVRQKPGSVIFDQTIPTPANTVQGAVVVTRVTEGTSVSNTRERPVMLLDVLDVGESTVDAARRLEISVELIVQNRPLIYRVRLRWNQPDPADTAGKFDLRITPWVAGLWETVDMWIDSPRNGQGIYEFFEANDPTKPIRNGDRPWVGRNNQIHARITNSGVVPIDDVYVSFYANSPPGIGDNGSWATLGTKQIPTIAAGASTTVPHDWIPAIGAHTCLRVEVLPKQGEIASTNNMAQENVFTFDSAGGSSHEPVLIEADVRSPFIVWRRVDLVVRGLPDGWHAAVDRAWVWLPPKGTKRVQAVVWTDLGTPAGDDREVPDLALASIEGWTDFDHRYLPIGGILASVKATQRVDVDCEISADGGTLVLSGRLRPSLPDIPITVEITDEHGRSRYLLLRTDGAGGFGSPQDEGRTAALEPGTYTVQVFVTAGGEAAETECPPEKIIIAGDRARDGREATS